MGARCQGAARYSIHLLYWYKSTNTDAEGAALLGLGDTDNRLVPARVGGFGESRECGVVVVACGQCHTLVVTEEGALWAFGRGIRGALGVSVRVCVCVCV